MSEYIKEFAGVVVLPDRMNCSLLSFARAIKVAILREQQKINPDNAVIAILVNAARLGWEQLDGLAERLNLKSEIGHYKALLSIRENKLRIMRMNEKKEL